MAHGPQQQGRHEARQGSGKQGHRQKKRQVAQDGGVPQGDQGRGHLADVVGRRAADGHAVYRQAPQPGQGHHYQHSQHAAQQGKQQGRGVAGKETAQQAPGHQNAQGRSGPQLIQGKHRDDIGKAQLHPRQGNEQRHGKQVFQGAQAQSQGRQHRAHGHLAGRYLHAAPPIPAPRRGRRHHR